MKKLIIIILLFQLNSILIAQPSDYQWYIWDNKYGDKASQNPQTLLNSNTIQINNVSHPGPDATTISGVLNNTKNDIFIIFDNGDYFNSRGGISTDCFSTGNITNWNYKLILDAPLPNGGGGTLYPTQIKYLYYSNIYEGDDPPSTVSITQPASLSLSIYSLTTSSYNQNSHRLSSNHDVVKGADYTLIIPKLWGDTCTRLNIQYPSDLFIIDQLLNPIPSATITSTSIGSLNIINPFNNNNNFNFLNFHTASDSPYSPDTFNIKVGCQIDVNGPVQNVNIIKDTVVAAHDPNYIEVRCISNEITPNTWPFGPKKVKVSYHIECYNDGIGDADTVLLNFRLPNIANPSKIWINSWKCGNISGCDKGTGVNSLSWNTAGRDISIKFNGGILKGINSPFSNRQAYVNFCVEIDTTNLFQALKSTFDLRITNASTTFDSNNYPIIRFIDPKKRNITQNDRSTYKSSCFCGCKSKKNDFSPGDPVKK